MNKKQAQKLLDDYLNGLCSPEEARLVERWYIDLTRRQAPAADYDPLEEREISSRAIRKNITRPVRTRLLYRIGSAAALILITIGIYVTFLDTESLPTGAQAKADAAPGKNKATLTLVSGAEIQLSEQQNGIVVDDGNIHYNDGSVVDSTAHKSALLTLATPKGGQYQVTLEDGTKVLLNSQTKLTYPSQFSDSTREVSLEGEAYFQVAKNNKAPFLVAAKNQKVRVIGTEFNVSAYAEEETVKTTLATGAVAVSVENMSKALRLSPAQQSILADGQLRKHPVNLENELAWTMGRFSFDNKPFPQIMTELARWYDLEIEYEGPVPTEQFIGGAFRDKNLAIVLGMLESAGIQYQMRENRKLMISNTAKHTNNL